MSPAPVLSTVRFALESVKITERVSAKFRWLSFLAAWAVVGIHSGTSRWTSRPDWSDGVQAQIIGLFGFAVPLFFMISGYLLVYSYEKYGFIKLIRLKVKSLYVPCVLWMVLSEALIIPIKLYCGEDVSAWTYLYAPLLVYENFSISFHLWYVRALLVVFLFSPIIWWLISTKARLCFSLVIIVGSLFLPSCVFHIGPYSVQYAKITVSSVLLGACLARLRNEERFGRIAVVISGLTLGVLLIMGFKLQAVPYKLVFAVLVWFGYDVLSDKVKFRNYNFLRVTFFVYCVHLVVIKYISGIGRVVMGCSPEMKLIFFCVNILSFWLCVIVGCLIFRFSPKLFSLLSGGR